MKNSKKALLVISFGTSHENAINSIENIEGYLQSKYPYYDFYRAFTSRMIIKKLKKRENVHIDFPSDALDKLYKQGYEEIVCQSLHVINGFEYEKTLKIISSYKDNFKKILFGRPLLTSTADYEFIADLFYRISQKHEAILFMGHGTNHFSNSAYCMLEDVFRYKGIENIFIATVEGFPKINYAIKKMKDKGIKRVTLMPFMVEKYTT